MDIWEANSMANAYTPHPCDVTGQLKCEGTDCGDNVKGERYDGVCDKDGCDINPYRMGNKMFYGRGSQYEINTLNPVTVVTQFLTTDGTDNGELSEMRRFYVQDGNVIESPPTTILNPGDNTDSITDKFCQDKKTLFGDVNDYADHGNSASMGESLDRGHVMAISLWDDVEVNMLWLDSAFPLNKPATDPGVQRGDCPGDETSTPTWLRQNNPNGWVSFQNAFVGPIGTFLQQPTQAPSPRPPPTPTFAPSPTQAPCTDSNSFCPDWAAAGECEANPAYMLANCRKSCGVCSGGPAPTPSGGPGSCCFGGCGSGNCAPGWCSESQANCEGNCNGVFCPSAGLASLKNVFKARREGSNALTSD